jgi:hypothetical protein
MTSTGFLFSQLEMFGTLNAELLFRFTLFAFQPQDNLTGRLGLLVENGFGLTTVSHLFTIVTTFALGKVTRLARLVLRYLVQRVLFALARAIGVALFGKIYHFIELLSQGRELAFLDLRINKQQ